MLSDEDEKENVSPDQLPTTVVVDCFGEIFEEAVRAMYTVRFVVFNNSYYHLLMLHKSLNSDGDFC